MKSGVLRWFFALAIMFLVGHSSVWCFDDQPYTHEGIDELNNSTIKVLSDSMGAMDWGMKSYISYTAAQNVPGTKESGVGYYYDNKTKHIKRLLFWRISQGYPNQTDRPLDLMIEGTGFFVIQLPGGWPAYTRDGRFSRARNGRMEMEAYRFPVLGQKGEIYLPSGPITVTKEGAIQSNRDFIDVLRIEWIANKQDLNSFNQSIFYLSKEDFANPEKKAEPKFTVLQGYIEDSAITKAYIGVVPEFKNSYESDVKVIKASLHNMSTSMQLANPQ